MPGMTRAGYTPEKPREPKRPVKPKQTKKPVRKKRRQKRMSRAALASLVVFAAAFAVAVFTLRIFAKTERYANAFSVGVMLSGRPMGGMTAADGAALLDKLTAEKLESWRYDITCQGRSYALTSTDVGLFVDKEATLQPLWQIGKEGGVLERYLQMLAAQAERRNAEPVIGYTMEPVDALLAQIKAETDCSPVDATVHYAPGSSAPFRFTDEQMGYTLDTAALRTAIEQAIATMTPGSTALEPREDAPSMTRAQLEHAITLRARVTMTLDADEGARSNACLAAGMLNALRIEPGQTLSFNEVIGRRTAEGGYVAAPEPAYGVGVSGVGGGICQVSSALYQAALLGDLEIVSRSAGVRPLPNCEMGQEAAVSDQGIDLVVKNPTATPIFITTRTYARDDGAHVLEMQLIGAPLAARSRLVSTATQTDVIEEPVYMEDATGQYATYRDERVPGSAAQPGYAVTVERVKLDESGAQTASEVISQEQYDPIAPVIYVGAQER